MKLKKLNLNRPSYFGLCILDLSRTLMYDFHYKKKSAKKAQFLFTNADSLTYRIKADVILSY